MLRNHRRRYCVLALAVATIALECWKCHTAAYWEMGFGLFSPVPRPGDYLNQHALTRAAAGSRAPSRNVYANNPNSYINRLRDNGFSSHYSPNSRRPSAYQEARWRAAGLSRASNNPPAPVTETVADERPVAPIGSFFDGSGRLVWPGDAPVSENLGAKRDVSDQASLVVMQLVEKHASAPITTVTDARQKLLDYGQPALQHMRSVTTAQIAEGFHMFLLALYDSLGAAANLPASTVTATPAP